MEAFAELVVGGGARVQPGQVVGIDAEVDHHELVRLLAEACYRRGAAFVDAWYFDPYVKRARLEHAPEATLDFVPPWYGGRLWALADQRAARIMLRGSAAPSALQHVDLKRAGRDALPIVAENWEVIGSNTTNWTATVCPSPGWAALVYPEEEPRHAERRLWDDIAYVCRLDDTDPIGAWRRRMDELETVARQLTARRFDRLCFRGPGTDLSIGLLETSRFVTALGETVAGTVHLANLPSEEIFTAPDPRRVNGILRATKPLVLGGSVVSGLSLRFQGGEVVDVEAASGAEVVRSFIHRDRGARRLGEVALVDGSGRVGRTKRVFYETLLDENAASHVALGRAYPQCVSEAEDRGRLNESSIHIDVTIGSPDLAVVGVDRRECEQPVLVDGRWCLP